MPSRLCRKRLNFYVEVCGGVCMWGGQGVKFTKKKRICFTQQHFVQKAPSNVDFVALTSKTPLNREVSMLHMHCHELKSIAERTLRKDARISLKTSPQRVGKIELDRVGVNSSCWAF